ncbi:hypothetical protein M569_09715, partial [Genlisea aurea]
SVSSPRRILSFSKNHRKERTSFPGEHGPKPSEVYGFIGSITTVVFTAIFLMWAYVPDRWLHSLGIHYYPNRFWALALPTYFIVTVVLGIMFYIGINLMATPPPTSLNTIFDEFSREPQQKPFSSTEDDESPIKPISDISISHINELMF